MCRLSSPSPITFGRRPMANITLSAAIMLLSDSRTSEFIARLFDCSDRMAARNSDAASTHLVPQMLSHIIVKAAQNILAAINKRHFAAKPRKDARKFNRNIAAALDHDSFRQFRQ